MNSLIGFYNALYAGRESSESGKPTPLIDKLLEHISEGSALDLGAGNGSNAIYLARKGFAVTAVDFSSIAMQKLQQYAVESNLNIEVHAENIVDFKFNKNFDSIVCTFVLHHLMHGQGLDLVAAMQSHAPIGGYNVITAYTQDGDFYAKEEEKHHCYFKSGQLKELYKDWEIIWYGERQITAMKKDQDGKQRINTMVALIARKII